MKPIALMTRILAVLLLLSMPAMAEETAEQKALREYSERFWREYANEPHPMTQPQTAWLLVDGHQVSGPMEAGTCKRLAERANTFYCTELSDCSPDARGRHFAECIQ